MLLFQIVCLIIGTGIYIIVCLYIYIYICIYNRVGEPILGFAGCGVPVFSNWFSTTFLTIVVEVMTLGLPQVCNLWLGVSRGMLPLKHVAGGKQGHAPFKTCGCG